MKNSHHCVIIRLLLFCNIYTFFGRDGDIYVNKILKQFGIELQVLQRLCKKGSSLTRLSENNMNKITNKTNKRLITFNSSPNFSDLWTVNLTKSDCTCIQYWSTVLKLIRCNSADVKIINMKLCNKIVWTFYFYYIILIQFNSSLHQGK